MRHHRLDLSARVGVRKRADDLVLAERPAVVFVDAVFDEDAGVLGHERRELTGVVLFHAHDVLRLAKDVADGLGREGLHQAALQEVDLLALRLEHPDRVEDRAFGRSPRDHSELCIGRTVQRVLLVLRDRLLHQRELAHALVHHRHAHLDALGDVAVGVVLVGRDPEAATRDARAATRRDPILRERVPEVLLHVPAFPFPLWPFALSFGPFASTAVHSLPVKRSPRSILSYFSSSLSIVVYTDASFLSDSTMIGIWYRSAQLKAEKMSWYVSRRSPGAVTMCGKSPCAGCSANCRSPCSCRVGIPVDGPPRWYRTSTGPGASVMDAKPMPSTMSAKPGPLGAVATRTPICAAPTAMLIELISSSHCTTSRL